MSNRDVTPFNFGNQAVRAVDGDGDVWFVAKDVVEAVDAVWKRASTIDHIPEQWRGAHPISTPGAIQEMAILSEQGVYFYLARSDKLNIIF